MIHIRKQPFSIHVYRTHSGPSALVSVEAHNKSVSMLPLAFTTASHWIASNPAEMSKMIFEVAQKALEELRRTEFLADEFDPESFLGLQLEIDPATGELEGSRIARATLEGNL